MGPLILAAIAGAAIFALTVATLVYRGRAIEAEMKRDEAITLSANALEAKKNAEEGFVKAKEMFQHHMNLPLNAYMTDEQVDRIAKYVAGKNWATANAISEIKQ